MEKLNLNWKYYIQTFGCQMNVHESEKVAGIFVELGFSEAEDVKNADVVMINTCAIRENAEKKIESYIGNLKAQKLAGNIKCICIMGCMTQQDNRANLLKQKFPFIDIINGTNNLLGFKEEFISWVNKRKSIINILPSRTAEETPSVYRTSGVNAYVNISFGCNNFCTYCIVPYVRGREISRPMEDILREVENLLKEGYKQITLLGQNVNSYGNDIEDENINFVNLVKEIDKFDYKFRLRFMTSHPKDLSEDLIIAIANSKHICHGIHLPVQSGSSKVLESMNRRYSREHYLSIVKKIKKHIPDCGLTTDIIVGFPGETEEDFEDTMSLIKEVGYQQIFGFLYSKRKGTVAEKMENHIPLATKKARLQRLIELEREIATEISNSMIGKTIEVLIEGTNKNYMVGSSDQNKNVNILIPDGKSFDEYYGKFINVKITSAKLTVLYAELVD